jgi:UDP-3-O-[3-hydroxymyristoyl] glucosamine N-acyltransferase
MKFNVPFSIPQVVEIIGKKVSVLGAESRMVSGINEIHNVEDGDLTFVDHPKYYQKALNSAATTIIINKEVECPEGKALIISEDPFRDYIKIVNHFRSFEPAVAAISPSARIGKNTVIQPGAFVGNHVVIGDDCIIHSNVSIYDHTQIGNRVVIHANAVIGADAYYFKKRPEYWDKMVSCGRAVIGDDVEIGALTTIDKGVSSDTVIGAGTKFDNHAHVGHDTHIGKNCLIGANTMIAGVTTLEDDCMIWANVSINKDIVIAKGTTILATSAIDKSTDPAVKVYFGVPAVEAQKKWRELAAIRMLPNLIDKLYRINREK